MDSNLEHVGQRQHNPLKLANIEEAIARALGKEDDPALWRLILDTVGTDAQLLCQAASRRVEIEIGACSHWLRPHQTRWTADGGFAWPTGYGGAGHSRFGLPALDWALRFEWDAKSNALREIPKRKPGSLTLRISIPARTTRHRQAAVHTLWTPAPPTDPRRTQTQIYGFRLLRSGWECTADLCLGRPLAPRSIMPKASNQL